MKLRFFAAAQRELLESALYLEEQEPGLGEPGQVGRSALQRNVVQRAVQCAPWPDAENRHVAREPDAPRASGVQNR